MRRATSTLRLLAAVAAAWFMVALASAHVGALVFTGLPDSVCVAMVDDGHEVEPAAHRAKVLAGHGLSCPLCAGPSTMPPPLAVARVPPPACLVRRLARPDTPALSMGRVPVHVRARGPPLEPAPWG
ncbi:MAG: hypothetical protein IPG93_12465 [Burkholderiales bacterium]|nr:hypothetical protein [Burkholderiales bacterium]